MTILVEFNARFALPNLESGAGYIYSNTTNMLIQPTILADNVENITVVNHSIG